jgi:hypothetical protein
LAVTYYLTGARHYPGQPALTITERGVTLAMPDTPAWSTRAVATPAFVREVAEWALSSVGRIEIQSTLS